MENSKLVELLRSFSLRERRSFRELALSGLNTHQEAARLLEWLEGFAPAYAGVTREAAHARLFPGQAPDEQQLNHTMSFLLRQAEDFIAREQVRRMPWQEDYFLLSGYMDRGLEKHYQFHLEKLRKKLSGALPDAPTLYTRFAAEILEAERFARQSPRLFNESVQLATDSLDGFYLLEKLRRTCYMYTSQTILATPYNLQLVEEICRFIGANLDKMPTPAIEAYYRIFQLLTHDESDADFAALKNLLATRAASFSREDLVDVYQYSINHCNLQIMKLRHRYVQEAFELYDKGVSSGILLDHGSLSPWHFKNIINLALRLKRYDWTEQFIHENTRLLAPEFQSDALHYNLALLYYNTGRRNESLIHLNQVELTDIHYYTGARVMLCQIYYQNDDFDALESLLHAFNTFLRRNRLVSEGVRKTYLNFTRIMQKMLRSLPDQYPAIAAEVESLPALAGKEWLLEMLRG